MKALITVQKIHKRYGSNIIFEDASTIIYAGQKIGVVGRNGAGKSTFCKILINEEDYDGGNIILNKELNLSYLEQHDPFKDEETVVEFLQRYTGKEDWECGKICGQFQIKNETFDQMPIHLLSGGYKTRVKLAAMLLQDPNFLVLDEPTNFLDLQTQILLENFLASYVGGFMIVSHDREFLRKTCKQTLDVSGGKMTPFNGSVAEYIESCRLADEDILKRNKTNEKKAKQLQTFINKNRARAAGAAQARNKQKQLDRLEFGSVDRGLKSINIQLPDINIKEGWGFKANDLSIGYPDKVVAKGINLEIEKGEHIAVLGENGQGKTTFLRTIAEDLSILDGGIQWGHGLEIAYYAQHVYLSIPETETIFSYLERKAKIGTMKQEILDLAGCFLFQGQDVEKSVKVLSGGERARLCLAGLLLSKKNVLLLDEPTNHLDFETIEALGNALKNYRGTVFFVSHDRSFVKAVSTHILQVEKGSIFLYQGKYDEYISHLEDELSHLDNQPTGVANEKNGENKPSAQKSKESKLSGKEANALRKKLKNQVRKLEKEISFLESEKIRLTGLCKSPESHSAKTEKELNSVTKDLEKKEEIYLVTFEEFESL